MKASLDVLLRVNYNHGIGLCISTDRDTGRDNVCIACRMSSTTMIAAAGYEHKRNS
jgi:hypothetical protein